MYIEKLIGNMTSVPSIDFNQVVKLDNISYWRISSIALERNKVELHVSFMENGIESSLTKRFNTIMEAVEYFYNFLKTI